MRRRKVMESSPGPMAGAIKDNGRTVNKKERDSTGTRRAWSGQECGQTVRKLNGLIE